VPFSKVATTTGAAITAVSKATNPENPSAARDLGVAQSLKMDPVIVPEARDENDTQRNRPTASRRSAVSDTRARIDKAAVTTKNVASQNTNSLEEKKVKALRCDMGDCLVEELNVKPQRTAKQAHERMKSKRKPNGGAFFSYSQRGEVKKYAQTSPEYVAWAGCSMCHCKPCTGCNGRVLSEDEIKTFFSNLAQKRKKEATKAKKAAPKKKTTTKKKGALPKKKGTTAKAKKLASKAKMTRSVPKKKTTTEKNGAKRA